MFDVNGKGLHYEDKVRILKNGAVGIIVEVSSFDEDFYIKVKCSRKSYRVNSSKELERILI